MRAEDEAKIQERRVASLEKQIAELQEKKVADNIEIKLYHSIGRILSLTSSNIAILIVIVDRSWGSADILAGAYCVSTTVYATGATITRWVRSLAPEREFVNKSNIK